MDNVVTGLVQILSSQSSAYVDVGNPDFYPYAVPSTASYNYLTLANAPANTWDTLGDVEKGYNIPVRIVVHTKEETGGTRKSVEITNTIEELLNKNHFDIQEGNVIFCKVNTKSRPMESMQEKGYFWQYVDVQIMTERS